MNKAELVSHLSEKVGVTKKQAEDMVECFVDTVVETLDVVDRNVPPDCLYTRDGKMLPIDEKHEARCARARIRETLRC